MVSEEFDLVVLSVGLEPVRDHQEIAKIFGVDLNAYGFAKTSTFYPLQTSKPGIFVSGVFSGPKDVPETVAQASAAAAEASSLLSASRGTLITEKEYAPEKASYWSLHLPLWDQYRRGCECPGRRGVCPDTSLCGLCRRKSLYLLPGYPGHH
jgi:hypothetical protein